MKRPEWNELIQSIGRNGLLVPLIVWERGEGGYIILSGHNRKRTLESLYDKTSDATYQKAPCVMYRVDSLTENEARSILVDCNWVQRMLTTVEKARVIRNMCNSVDCCVAGISGGMIWWRSISA